MSFERPYKALGARFAFSLEHVPFQMLKRYLDHIGTDVHFHVLRKTRTALSGLSSFDKACYLSAKQSVAPASRNALVAAQTLGLWSTAKDKILFLEGDGKCAHCGGKHGGSVYETWDCPALAETQLECDKDLQHLNTMNTPLHVLMGLPPQLDEEEKAELITPLPGCRIHDGEESLLTFGKTKQREGWDFFNRLVRFPGITAARLAHSLTFHCSPPPANLGTSSLPTQCLDRWHPIWQ